MLSIGEFSNLCKVSPKTLRHYAAIGLLLPSEINPETGYRYYATQQLKTMLFINRLKGYGFSLEEIRGILQSGNTQGASLSMALAHKKKEMEERLKELGDTLQRLEVDAARLEKGEPLLAYLDEIDVEFTEVPTMNMVSIRKMVEKDAFPEEYRRCFGGLLEKIRKENLTPAAPPMVLFHSAEFGPAGMDTEFAIPVKDYVTGTRVFSPGLCLKTVLRGSYSGLPSVYAKQRAWAEQEGYASSGALVEVYVTDPSQAADEGELITQVMMPVRKKKGQSTASGRSRQ